MARAFLLASPSETPLRRWRQRQRPRSPARPSHRRGSGLFPATRTPGVSVRLTSVLPRRATPGACRWGTVRLNQIPSQKNIGLF